MPFFGPLHYLKVRETRKKSLADRLRHLLTRLQQRRSVSLLLRPRLCGGESHTVQGSPTCNSRTRVSEKNGEDICLSGLHQHLTQRWWLPPSPKHLDEIWRVQVIFQRVCGNYLNKLLWHVKQAHLRNVNRPIILSPL